MNFCDGPFVNFLLHFLWDAGAAFFAYFTVATICIHGSLMVPQDEEQSTISNQLFHFAVVCYWKGNFFLVLILPLVVLLLCGEEQDEELINRYCTFFYTLNFYGIEEEGILTLCFSISGAQSFPGMYFFPVTIRFGLWTGDRVTERPKRLQFTDNDALLCCAVLRYNRSQPGSGQWSVKVAGVQ